MAGGGNVEIAVTRILSEALQRRMSKLTYSLEVVEIDETNIKSSGAL